MAETLYPLSALATIVVSTDTGATVYVIDAKGKRIDATEVSGKWTFEKLSKGTCTIYATKYGITETKTQYVEKSNTYSVSIAFRVIPTFTYDGSYALLDDSDAVISNLETYRGNWKIRFFTSGTFKFTKLNGAANGINVFCVGGGGGAAIVAGGGGGYTKTGTVNVSTGTSYSVVIGSGGAGCADYSKHGSTGGNTSAFGITANGGEGGKSASGSDRGGNGGSGGGGGSGGKGGSDGSNGTNGVDGNGGTGQGTTTREFGASNGKLYAGGGSSAYYSVLPGGDGGGGNGGTETKSGSAGTTNTGGGGGAGYASGGSGIVVIRNKR